MVLKHMNIFEADSRAGDTGSKDQRHALADQISLMTAGFGKFNHDIQADTVPS